MNTTGKGNELENEVYEIINEMLDNYGKFVIPHKHKKYLGSNGREFIFDVSIDCFVSKEAYDEDKPYLVIIYECKNENRILDVSEYDEWLGKLRRFGETGHKLYIVSRKGFSKKTIEYARSDKVGLIKIPEGESTFNYIVHRTINKIGNDDLFDELMGNVSLSNEIVCYENHSFVPFADHLLNNDIPIKETYSLDVPFLKNEAIENFVEDLLSKYTWSLDILDDLVKDRQELTISSKRMTIGKLGELDVLQSNIFISEELEVGSSRYRFVLAHELGHYFLHMQILFEKIIAFYEDEESLKSLYMSGNKSKIMEQQANRFASYLLMPRKQIIREFYTLFKFRELKGSFLYVDDQKCNLENYNFIVYRLSHLFKVSKQAITYRLMDLKLIQITDEGRRKIGF